MGAMRLSAGIKKATFVASGFSLTMLHNNCRLLSLSLDSFYICPDVFLALSNKRASSVQKLGHKFFYPLDCCNVASA